MQYPKFKVGPLPHTYVMEGGIVTDEDILAMAKSLSRDRLSKGRYLVNPGESKDYLQHLMQDYEEEVFAVLMFDTRQRVIGCRELFRGTISSSMVYPREVVKTVLAANAASVILAHNHPSGNPEPSFADVELTRRLRDALALVEVRVLDHIVVGRDGTVSVAERGKI